MQQYCKDQEAQLGHWPVITKLACAGVNPSGRSNGGIPKCVKQKVCSQDEQ